MGWRGLSLLLLILGIGIGPWSTVFGQQQGDRVTAPYKPGTVRVTAEFAGGDKQEGFGFVVGERGADLFVVTANHVTRQGKGPDTERAALIEIRFAAAPWEPYETRRLGAAPELDLALLKVDKPAFEVPWQQGFWCRDYQRGDRVWFIGRDQEWFVPLDLEAGLLRESEPDFSDRVHFATDSVRTGTSGAPLIHTQGIIGMIVQDRSVEAEALDVNKIRRFVQAGGYPWGLQRCGGQAVQARQPAAVTPPQTPEKIPLVVKTSPDDARVRILNIVPKYEDGMELESGRYRIEVTREGFEKSLSWFDLSTENRVYPVELVPLASPGIATGGSGSEKPNNRSGLVSDNPAGVPFRDRLSGGGEGPSMVQVPKGCFRMGDVQGGGGDDEQPVREVCLEGFGIGAYEVTFEDYDRFAVATGREKPSDAGWGRGRQPVINVTWHDANAYAGWLSEQTGWTYRLPTEAQWEYAARAVTDTTYWWGNEIGNNRANCGDCGSRWDGEQTAPVGSFESNRFGLYDTVGNVWEWTCSEKTDRYDGSEERCVGASSPTRPVFRGGSWNFLPGSARAAARYWYEPDLRDSDLGFRLVRLARI